MVDFEVVEFVPEDFHRKELIQFLDKDTKNSIIKTYENEIEDLYTMHYPRMVSDLMSMSIYYERQSIESLVLEITAKKNTLEKFKRKARNYCNNVYKILCKYKPDEQKEIMHYFNSKGMTPYTNLISSFVQESYRENEAQRLEKHAALEKLRKKQFLEDVEEFKKRQMKEVIRI